LQHKIRTVGLLDNIKRKIGDSVLKRNHKSNRRRSRFHNFATAKHINILFDARTELKFRVIKNFIKEMEDSGKFVSALGFVEKDQDTSGLLYKKDVNFFSPKQLNWYGKPTDETVKAFVIDKPDILFNLCLDDNFAVKFITAASQADFIISGKKDDPYADFIVDVTGNNDPDFLLKQIKYYLQIIKRA